MFINNFNFSRISLLYESLGSGTISNQLLIIWEPLVNLVNFLARKHHIGLLFFFLGSVSALGGTEFRVL